MPLRNYPKIILECELVLTRSATLLKKMDKRTDNIVQKCEIWLDLHVQINLISNVPCKDIWHPQTSSVCLRVKFAF